MARGKRSKSKSGFTPVNGKFSAAHQDTKTQEAFDRVLREGGRITFADNSPAIAVPPGSTVDDLPDLRQHLERIVRTGVGEDVYTQPTSLEGVVKGEALRTGTSTILDTEAISRAYREQVEQQVRHDTGLIEKVREKGIRLGVDMGRQKRGLQAIPAGLVGKGAEMPLRYLARMARPSGMPEVRSTLLTHLKIEEYAGTGPRPLPLAPEHDWTMYFATADFADLFHEMQRDFTAEKVEEYVADILEEWGPRGQVVVGFDLNRLPVVRVSKVYRDSISAEGIAPDPNVWSVEGEPDDRMRLGSLSFQWVTHEEDGTLGKQPVELFVGLHSAGDTLRTSLPGSPSTRDAVLIAWMLSSRTLRMLEAKRQSPTAGMPPKAKAQLKRKPLRDETVTVVTLRRHVRAQVTQVQNAEKSGRQYVHRFVVRGHWRNQAYGTNRLLRRRTYILPYVKGPDGAPFMERERVFQW